MITMIMIVMFMIISPSPGVQFLRLSVSVHLCPSLSLYRSLFPHSLPIQSLFLPSGYPDS
eukprot:m.57578 g.57578  ORF g.57578 m.57578 type:complete len:60 (-) comp6842_c0_seq1:537-716(-)